jgi:hypothetical protein
VLDQVIRTAEGAESPPRVTKLLTTDEVAKITHLSPETLAQWRWLTQRRTRFAKSSADKSLVRVIVVAIFAALRGIGLLTCT